MPIPSRSVFPARKSLPAAGCAALLALCAWASLQGCKTVEIDAPKPDTTATVTDSASIQVTNHIEIDADSVIMLLYAATSEDIATAVLAKRLKAVASNGSVVMKVPVGTWKLGYKDVSGELIPMTDLNSPAQEWLKAIFVKNAIYSLILDTDTDVKRVKWTPTFATDPAIQ